MVAVSPWSPEQQYPRVIPIPLALRKASRALKKFDSADRGVSRKRTIGCRAWRRRHLDVSSSSDLTLWLKDLHQHQFGSHAFPGRPLPLEGPAVSSPEALRQSAPDPGSFPLFQI